MPDMGEYTSRTSTNFTIRRYLSRGEPQRVLYDGPNQSVLDGDGNRTQLITAKEIKHAIECGEVHLGPDGQPCIDVYPNGAIVVHQRSPSQLL